MKFKLASVTKNETSCDLQDKTGCRDVIGPGSYGFEANFECEILQLLIYFVRVGQSA